MTSDLTSGIKWVIDAKVEDPERERLAFSYAQVSAAQEEVEDCVCMGSCVCKYVCIVHLYVCILFCLFCFLKQSFSA